MLPTIIFFIALISSIVAVTSFIDSIMAYYMDKGDANTAASVFLVSGVIACLMWSWLFYLLH